MERLFHELAKLGVAVPESVFAGPAPATASANPGNQRHAILARRVPGPVKGSRTGTNDWLCC